MPGAVTTHPFLRFEHVQKAFGANVVYRDLSLEIARGETVTILGGSGSGKSVLLKLLIGLLRPDRGAIFVEDTDLTTLEPEALLPLRRRISMLFQGGALFDSLSVGENVAYPLREHLRLSEPELRARVLECLALVGLPNTLELMPSVLSGGMRKRVGLARALAAHPEVLLYDEPTTGLDPINTRRVCELIRSLQARLNVTSVVVTHDLGTAYLVSDRIAMLHGGRVLVALPVRDFRRCPDPEIREFTQAMEVDA